jgi:hypothetical protein
MILYHSQHKINNSTCPPNYTNPAGSQGTVQECLRAQDDCYFNVIPINIPL